MAWTFNGAAYVTIPNGSEIEIPDDSWTFVGWVRFSDLAGSDFKRLICWGTPGDTPHIQVYIPEADGGYANSGKISARYIDPNGDGSSILWAGFDLSSCYNYWTAFCFTHNSGNNLTVLRSYTYGRGTPDNDSNTQSLIGTTTSNITDDLYIGSSNALGTNRLEGDLAEIAFIPGTFFTDEHFDSFRYGTRPYRYNDCSWHVPMIDDRVEEWINQLSINTVNISATGDHPPIGRISRPLSDPEEITPGYITTHNESVTSNLSLTHNTDEYLLSQSVNNTLNLTHDAVVIKDITKTVNQIINFDSSSLRVKISNITQNLFITQVVSEFNYIADREPAGNTLNLAQNVLVSSNPDASNDLDLTQNVSVDYPTKLYASSYIGFSSKTSTPHRAFIEQDVGISQRVNTPPSVQSITQNLTLTHSASIGFLTSTLNLVGTATFAFAYDLSNDFDIEHTLGLESNFVRPIDDDADIGHSLTWYLDSPCAKKQYTPFQGDNTSSSVTAPSNTLQDPQGDSDTFSLYTPCLGVPTSKVTIRKPELDNRDRNAYTRINQETRGGKLIVYADPDWPNVRTLAVTIVGLTETKVDEFQTFVQDNIGNIIGLSDWEGRLWKGFITNPNDLATQDGKDRWTISFEFEGEMLEVEQPSGADGDSINLNHSVSAVIA